MRKALRIVMFAVFAAAVSVLMFSSCGGGGASSLLVIAEADTDSGATVVTVIIQEEDGMPVVDAAVTVNSETVPHAFFGIYIAAIVAVNEGGNVSLQVQRGGTSVSGTVSMPDQPNVTAPTTAGGPYSRSTALTVEWNDFSPDPDQFLVSVEDAYTVDLDGYTQILDGSETTWDIPQDTFKDANQTGVTVEVGAVNSTTLSGSGIASGSMLAAANLESSQTFDMNQ